MLNCVYKIKFGKSSYELVDDYDRLSDYEKERISELDAESFFDCDDNGNYICYVITSPLEIRSYLQILETNLIGATCDDLSTTILKSKINIETELKPKLNSENLIKYDFFIEDLNDWIYENLDMDTVLDKISSSGMSSLSDVEKLFLQNYN